MLDARPSRVLGFCLIIAGCLPDGQGKDRCLENKDCTAGRTCVGLRCQPAVSSDASSPPAQPSDAAPSCPPGLLCENFEGGALGASWTGDLQNRKNGTVTLDAQRAFRGKQSLAVAVGDGFSSALISMALPPEMRHELWGRVMVWVDSLPNQPWVMAGVTGAVPFTQVPGPAFLSYGGEADRPGAHYVVGEVDCSKDGGATMPVGRWACLRWHFSGPKDAQDVHVGEVDLWLDACPLRTAAVMNGMGSGCDHPDVTWYAPSFERLYLGIESYAGPPPDDSANAHRVWFDDLVISSAAVECPAPAAACAP
jgi:hypothetical protein